MVEQWHLVVHSPYRVSSLNRLYIIIYINMYTCKLTLGLDTGTFQKKSARQFERIDYEHRARRDVLVCSSAFFSLSPLLFLPNPMRVLIGMEILLSRSSLLQLCRLASKWQATLASCILIFCSSLSPSPSHKLVNVWCALTDRACSPAGWLVSAQPY